jgi:hypothetical protein
MSLRKLWLKLFPRTKRVDFRFVSYADAEPLIKQGWRIATPEEDSNNIRGYVFLELRERVTE